VGVTIETLDQNAGLKSVIAFLSAIARLHASSRE